DAGVEAPTDQAAPDTVDVTAGKPGVARAGHPPSQGLAALAVRGVDRDVFPGEGGRLHGQESGRILLVGHLVLAVLAPLDGVGRPPAVDVLVLDEPGPAEECGEAVELLALPERSDLGMMALGTLDLQAEEDTAGGGGDLGGVAVEGRQVVDRRDLVVDAIGS